MSERIILKNDNLFFPLLHESSPRVGNGAAERQCLPSRVDNNEDPSDDKANPSVMASNSYPFAWYAMIIARDNPDDSRQPCHKGFAVNDRVTIAVFRRVEIRRLGTLLSLSLRIWQAL